VSKSVLNRLATVRQPATFPYFPLGRCGGCAVAKTFTTRPSNQKACSRSKRPTMNSSGLIPKVKFRACDALLNFGSCLEPLGEIVHDSFDHRIGGIQLFLVIEPQNRHAPVRRDVKGPHPMTARYVVRGVLLGPVMRRPH